MTRPSAALIDLRALRHNARVMRSMHGGRQIAVLKSNAYGHGAVACARALGGTSDGFGVAFLEEARQLRAAGIEGPLLVLEGAFDARELVEAVAGGIALVVHHEDQLRMIERTPLPRVPASFWLKIDSGMHRAGFAPDAAAAAYRRLQATGQAHSITLMTHFARADEPDCPATREQLAVFEAATQGLAGPRSLCNSAGILAWPAARRDWGRPGIALYGADPLGSSASPLAPVMTLRSHVFSQRLLQPGETLGYGGAFRATEPTRVGLVALGYADGYPRAAATGTPVAVDGQRTRLIGRVSMDMLTVDLTPLPHAGIGSPVELWGPTIPVNEVASRAGTIAYELLCNVKRVPLQYLD
ncbi:alanine racemase [Pelomonas sp. BJYL3]|uniref:alanine racemase n=1 Tax=Pelomonas sp. BJYL3 TaxID=2976697 RepID=UPI0022B40748|nr:alanine racemase [Pelomonas sp. BJYL3]